MRKTLLASALMLALASSAYAGDMQFPVTPPPPPAPTSPQMQATRGEIQHPLVEVTFRLLKSVLVLF